MPEQPGRIVIVGGGLAGAKGAEALRSQGYTGDLTLAAEEQELPYERPPLSKKYLMGQAPFEDAVVHDADWYADNDVDLRLGVHATSLDVEAHRVSFTDGASLHYDKLLLATGAFPRRLDVPGGDAVKYLRSHADSDGLRSLFGPGRRVVVIGTGWIALEVTAAAREAGTDVTLVGPSDVPLHRVLGTEMGSVFAELHREHDVDLRFGTSVSEVLVEDGEARGVRLADGTELGAVGVIAGVGVLPNVALASAAGLSMHNGIEVDAGLRSSDPDVYAVGDIANHDHPVLGYRIRVEHWANALNQPAVAAARMLGDEDATYDNLPYFFTDQYDLGMEFIGHTAHAARVVTRGDVSAREFVAFWLDDDSRLVAAMNVNVWDVVDELKPIIAEKRKVDAERLTDRSVAYSDL